MATLDTHTNPVFPTYWGNYPLDIGQKTIIMNKMASVAKIMYKENIESMYVQDSQDVDYSLLFYLTLQGTERQEGMAGKGASVMVKYNEQWRKNQPSRVIQYYNVMLGKLLKEQRISQTKLANFLNISVSTVNQYVNGMIMPPDDIQDIIALFLGKTHAREVWVFKGKHLYHEMTRLNKLHREVSKVESKIQKLLNDEENGTGKGT